MKMKWMDNVKKKGGSIYMMRESACKIVLHGAVWFIPNCDCLCGAGAALTPSRCDCPKFL